MISQTSYKEKNIICHFTDRTGNSVEVFATDRDEFDVYAVYMVKNQIIRHWDKNDIQHQRNGAEDIFAFVDEHAVSVEYIQEDVFNPYILIEAVKEGRYINMITKILQLQEKRKY